MQENIAPIRKRRPRRYSEIKVRSVLQAAAKLFLRDGVAATSMDAVALEAAVSKRTVYNHFGSKEELLAGIIKDLCSKVLPSSAIELDGKDQSIESHLTAIGLNFLSSIYSTEQIKLLRTVITESRVYPELGQIMFDGPVSRSHGIVRAYFAKLERRGEIQFANLELAPAQFLGMLKTDLQLRQLLNIEETPTARELEKVVRSSVQLFLHGALASKRAQARQKPRREKN